VTACVAGFSDNGEMWRNEFETETFVEDMQQLWKEVEPLYLELHTFVRRKLKELYKDKMADDDLIPAHILGSCKPISITTTITDKSSHSLATDYHNHFVRFALDQRI
jgi:hypothetical protein